MTFWIAAFLLTLCATGLVVWPLVRPVRRSSASAAHDVSVYRDQLDEVERDMAGGSLNGEEADAARAEIGRRLIRAAAEEKREIDAGALAAPRRRRLALLVVFVFIPLSGIAGYMVLGTPGAPSMPLSAREAGPDGNPELASLVKRAESHLKANPDDGRGWDVLAPIYLRSGRIQDAAIAYGNAIGLLGSTAEREAGLGEALVMQNDGSLTDAATNAFHRALDLKPDDPKAQFFLAVGLAQAGKKGKALAAFHKLKKQGPANAAWAPMVDRQIAALDGTSGNTRTQAAQVNGSAAPPGNPTTGQMAAADQMSAKDRVTMIHGMVDRLDRQLSDDPNNLAGWKRLVRSYMVLGETAKAEAAMTRALKTFPAESDGGQQLMALAGSLGVETETRQ